MKPARPLNRLAVLVLLLAGLFQTLAVAQGSGCARLHHPSPAAAPLTGATVAGGAVSTPVLHPLTIEAEHPPVPAADPAAVAAAPCGTVALLPADREAETPATPVRPLLARGDLPPVGFPVRSLFRPPRLS